MPELHREGWSVDVRRQRREEALEQPGVVGERRRTLEQHAPEAIAQELPSFEEIADVVVDVLQLLPVSDPLVRLQREDEAVFGSLFPRQERLLAGEPPERVVDLDRRELRRVIPQHVVFLEVVGVEDALAPLVVGEARRPQVEVPAHAVHDGTP